MNLFYLQFFRSRTRFTPARLIAPFLLTLAIASSVLADGGKVESIGAFADAGASDSLKKALEPKGYRVSLADGVLCEIWLMNAVAAGKNDAQGATYTWVADSALLGVITFPKAGTDFRKQPIKAGSYTLRYAVHPQDGNHIGISPIRDFLLLVPVAVDQDPNAKYKFEELTAMSKRASGTNHPSPLSLVSPDGISTWPSVFEDENSHSVFAAKLKTDAGAQQPIAFVVKGVVETIRRLAGVWPDDGRWTTDDGRQTMDHERWTTDNRSLMVYGPSSMVYRLD